MAKASKPQNEGKTHGKHDEPLKVEGTFMDIMNAAVKHMENNVPAEKKLEDPDPTILRDVKSLGHSGG